MDALAELERQLAEAAAKKKETTGGAADKPD
jgi:hypothetical protein